MSPDPVRPGPGETELRERLHDPWTGANVGGDSGLPDSYHEAVYEKVDAMLEMVGREFVPASVADDALREAWDAYNTMEGAAIQLEAERDRLRLLIATNVARASGLAEAIRDMDRTGLPPGATGVPDIAGEIADLLDAALSGEADQNE